jgi:hypothetical protein
MLRSNKLAGKRRLQFVPFYVTRWRHGAVLTGAGECDDANH